MLVMSLIVPGSAQLAARNLLLSVLTTGWVLWVGSWLVLALGLFWAFLIVNAWWAARPRDMGAVRAGILGGIAIVLAGAVAYGTVFTSSALRSSGSLVSTVLARTIAMPPR